MTRPEHLELADHFDLPDDGVLPGFQRFCDEAAELNDSMEWSWKFRPDHTLRNRAFWIGRTGRRADTADHIDRLADSLDFEPDDLDGGRRTWDEIIRTRTDRVTVGYAGADPVTGSSPVLKLFLSLEPHCDDVYRDLLRSLHGALPPQPPPGPCRVILVQSLRRDAPTASRVYVLVPQSAYDRPDVVGYLTDVMGSAGVDLARQHPSSGFGVKNDSTNMVAVSFSPTGVSNENHPCHHTSPVLQPVLAAGGREPQLARRIDRLTWVALPPADCDAGLGFEVSELNVYVRIDGSGRERT